MFKRLAGADETRRELLNRCNPAQRTEILPLNASIGRIISKNLLSDIDLPAFNRAAMDGFAVRSCDTRGAKPQFPAYLDHFQPIRTGMVVPENYDAVAMLEDVLLQGHLIEVSAELYPYKNISKSGEDVHRNEIVFEEGHRLRPPDIALLAALEKEKVEVYARPRVAIIPTGGELVPLWARSLRPGEAYEINGLMIQLYIEMWGGEPFLLEVVPDNHELIRSAIEANLNMDMIIVIGGTSVGEKDYTPKALKELGDLLAHGVRIQPGKPTALGIVHKKPVICLPGYPVAALSSLYLFVRPALLKIAHLEDRISVVRARLNRKIASKSGYLNIVRVKLNGDEAIPISASGAGILSSVAKAHGFILIPEEKEGLEAGEEVEVNLFE
ncbi:MAG: molybdopterin molybdotransferase MoeA [Methanotrichaceae archaeon]|nr:molybdopterin molybdotransferase MoeA [Methanotrichaceae archaeon]